MVALLRQRNYGLLWCSAFVSGIGNYVLITALPYYVYTVSGSTLARGALLISETLPMLLFSSVGGIFADRWRRKPVIIASDVLRGFILMPLLLVHSAGALGIVYMVAFLGASVAHFAGPFGNAALPHVVREHELPTANAAFSAGGFLAVLIGASLGALLLQHGGLRGIVLVDTATFFASAFLISLVNSPFEDLRRRARSQGERERRLRQLWDEWWVGIRFVLDERWLRFLFLMMMLVFLGNSMVAVCLAPFVRHDLHGTAQLYAWTVTAQGTGGLLASTLIGRVSSHLPPARMLGWSIGALGVCDLAIAAAQSAQVTVGAAFLAGIVVLFGVAAMNTLVQGEVADAYRGRVSGAFLSTSAFAALLGSGIASLSADKIGIRVVLGLGGGVFVLAGVVALTVLVPVMRQRTERSSAAEVPLLK